MPPGALTVAVVEPPLGTLLVTAIGGIALAASRLTPTGETAITLSAITAAAEPEHGLAFRIETHPLPKNDLAVQRHPPRRRGFDNGANSWQLQFESLVAFFAKVAELQEPRR